MEVLDTLEITWETVPEYLDQLDRNLGVNVGNLIGHTAVRYYVMGDECQKRTATDDEITADAGPRARRHEGRRARPLGVAQPGPFRPAGRPHPGDLGRREGNLRARRRAARAGHRPHPVGRRQRRRDEGRADEPALARRPAAPSSTTISARRCAGPASGRSTWSRSTRPPRKGIRAFPMCTPNRITDYFTMRNTQTFRGLPVWHPICLSSPEEMLKAYADPEVRRQAPRGGGRVQERAGDRHLRDLVGLHGRADRGAAERTSGWRARPSARSPRRRARASSTASSTWRSRRSSTPNGCTARTTSTTRRWRKILTYPNAIIGLSDGGAHVQFQSGFGFSTRLLVGMGAREADHVAGERGAAADLRSRPRPSGSTTAACCAPAWSPTS